MLKPKKSTVIKPTLETHSEPCCGQCLYCHSIPEDKRRVGCFVYPPEYLYGDVDQPEFGAFKPTEATRPHCKEYQPKHGAN